MESRKGPKKGHARPTMQTRSQEVKDVEVEPSWETDVDGGPSAERPGPRRDVEQPKMMEKLQQFLN